MSESERAITRGSEVKQRIIYSPPKKKMVDDSTAIAKRMYIPALPD